MPSIVPKLNKVLSNNVRWVSSFDMYTSVSVSAYLCCAVFPFEENLQFSLIGGFLDLGGGRVERGV
jgi:hypothetical protein